MNGRLVAVIESQDQVAPIGAIIRNNPNPADSKSAGFFFSEKGQVIRLPLNSINKLGRSTQGVRLMKFKQDDDSVSSVAFI